MKIKFYVILVSLLTGISFAQGVTQPLYSDVYKFLSRQAALGNIIFNDEIRPLSREYIYKKLVELNEKSDTGLNISNLDKLELEFWLKDFNLETIRSKTENENEKADHHKFFTDELERYRLFTYSNDIIRMNIDPIYGFKIDSYDNGSATHSWNGIRFYGYINDKIAFNFDFRDNEESGKNLDRTKIFTPETGVIKSLQDKDKFQYSEIHTSLSYSWSWGNLTAAKDFLNWGYGGGGLLVLSSKAPSFPYIKLDLHPAKWLSFNYFHAWLNSRVVDSSAIYKSLRYGNEYSRTIYRKKFLASHTLTIKPIDGISLMLGESVVYSDNLEIAYLFPLMFFRAADHYLSGNNNNAGANSQFFFGFNARNIIPKTEVYGSLIIDEVRLQDIFSKELQRNQAGYTFGLSNYDLVIPNSKITVEYTRIQPFVYRHYIPTQTYESDNYILGHWIGHNADLLFVDLEYRIIRGLKTNIFMQLMHKGEDGTPDDQYTMPSKPFLFGLNKSMNTYGMKFKYEPYHDLIGEIGIEQTIFKTQLNSSDYREDKKLNLSFAIYYGM